MRPDELPQQLDDLPASVRDNDKVRAAFARLAATGALANPDPPADPVPPPPPPEPQDTEPTNEGWMVKAVPEAIGPRRHSTTPATDNQPVTATGPDEDRKPSPPRPEPQDVEPTDGSWMVRPGSEATGAHRRWSQHSAGHTTAPTEDWPPDPPRSVRGRRGHA